VRTSSQNGSGHKLVDELTHAKPVVQGDAAIAVAIGQIKGFTDELLQALPVAVYTTDAQGLITSFNEAAAKLWGCRPEIGKSEYCGSYRLYWADGTPLPLDQCPMAMTLREKRPIGGMEAICERPDGTRVALIPNPTPLFDKSGTLIGAVNIVVDISERKRAEEVYAFTDRLYRARSASEVYEAGLDAIVRGLGCSRASVLLFDDAGVMRFAAWRALSDEYRDAVAGHSSWSRHAKDPEPTCIGDIESSDLPESVKAAVRAERIGALAFFPLSASGVLIGKFMAYYDAPHIFADAERKLALTIARQLGFGIERMRAEQSSRLLTSIITTSDDSIISMNIDGIVTSWNKGAERLFGYASGEMLGRSITALIPSERHDEELAILDRIRRGEHIDHYETIR
jgi:PAS domain S-box-containing protein